MMQLRKRMESLVSEMLDGQILLSEAIAEFEKVYIEKAVEKFGSQVTRTAAALGIHRNTLAKHFATASLNGRNAKTIKKSRAARSNSKAKKVKR